MSKKVLSCIPFFEERCKKSMELLKKNGFESSDKKIVLYDSGGEDYCCVTNTGIYGRLVELPDYIQSLKESDKDYFRYVMESGK